MQEHQSHFVYVRNSWTSSWVYEPYLYADQVSWSTPPSISTAQLTYRFGRILQPSEPAFAEYNRTNWLDYFVKVQVHQADGTSRVWYGVIVDDSRDMEGGRRDAFGDRIPSGTQVLTAFGLEYLLKRKPVTTSVIATDAGVARINRAIGFNVGEAPTDSAFRGVGNRSLNLGPDGVCVFRGVSETESTWSAYEIVRYLLKYQSPVDDLGNVQIPFVLDESNSVVSNLKWHTPILEAQDRTVFDLLNRIIHKGRLTGWKVILTNDESTAQLLVFAFNESAITTNTVHLDANQNQVSIDPDENALYHGITLHKATSNTFHRVIARGERRTSIVTLDYDDTQSLDQDWSLDEEILYRAVAISGDPYLKELKREQFRASDAVKRVYRYYCLMPTFDGTLVGSGTVVFPDSEGEVEPFWYPGLRFLRLLPIKKDYDYTGDNIADGTVTSTAQAGAQSEYLEPIVLIKEATDRWWHIEQLGRSKTFEGNGDTSGFDWSASVRMRDDWPGLVLNVHGAPQHVLAGPDFFAADADDLIPDGLLYWQQMKATVCCEMDSYAEVKYPSGAFVTAADVVKVLTVNVPGHRLDYVVPGTVVGIDADGALLTSSGGYVTDTRATLEGLARIAYEWYSQERQSLTITLKNLTLNTSLLRGTLITTLGGGSTLEFVNSVITDITMDLRRGTTTFSTQFGELDVGAL